MNKPPTMRWHREQFKHINRYQLSHMICIRTEYFSIGVMGRSASRSIARYICGDLTAEECHGPFMRTFDEFNSISGVPNILVLRNPLERAKSGSLLSYNKYFHGAPFLSKIDYNAVSHILPFENIKDYIGSDNDIEKPVDEDLKKLTIEQKLEYYQKQWIEIDGVTEYADHDGDEVRDRILNPWSVDEYDYTEEMGLYHEFLKKPVIGVDEFQKYVGLYDYLDALNFKVPGKRTKKIYNK